MEETSMPLWFWVLYWAVIIINLASMWKLYLKANQPGWASIIPIYNAVIMLKIIGRPVWWLLLLFVPVINFVIGITVSYEFVKSYGKGLGFFFGILFLSPIFYPILAFGDAQYIGPNGKQAPGPENPNQVPPPPPPPIVKDPNTV